MKLATILICLAGLILLVLGIVWWSRREVRKLNKIMRQEEQAAKARIEEMRQRQQAERSMQALRDFMAKRELQGTATADEIRILDEYRREQRREQAKRRQERQEIEVFLGRPLVPGGDDWGAGPSRSNHSSGGGYGGDGYSTGGGFGGGSHSSSSSYDSSSSSDSGSSSSSSSSSSCGSD